MSNGALVVVSCTSWGIALVLAVVAWVIRKNNSDKPLSLRATIPLLILWIISLAMFLGGTITYEAQTPQDISGLWFFGVVAHLVGIGSIFFAAVED